MPNYKRSFSPARLVLLGMLVLLLHLLLMASSLGDTSVCASGCDYSSISKAMNASSTDDTINVQGGLFRESPIIAKKVSLHGLDVGEGKPALSPEDGPIILAAYGTVLRGFEISRSSNTSEGDADCALEVILPASIYLNDLSGKEAVCAEDAASWNSSVSINYQFNSRVLRSRLGNYWKDYNGTDGNNDGVGDQPWILNDKNIDYYPLMFPVDSYRIPDEKETKVELIHARVGEPFTISLPSNPTTGYSWTVDYDYVLLKQGTEEFEDAIASQNSMRVGAGGTQVFQFTPISTGKTTIYFVYKRSWENIVADTRSFHVEIVA
jgi:predicted secreted protein